MKVLLGALAFAAVGVLLMIGCERLAPLAHADSGSAIATLDAGSVPDAGSAVAAPPMPDPIGHPADTVSTVSKLYHSGAWVPLSIVLAFILLLVVTKETSWLQQGKRAAYAAAGLGALAILVVPAAQGTSPSLAMIVSALGAAIALIVNPAKAPQS